MCCFLEQETFTPQIPVVLVISRNRWSRLNMTEKLFTGTLNHNQNKNKNKNKCGVCTNIFSHIQAHIYKSSQRLEPEYPCCSIDGTLAFNDNYFALLENLLYARTKAHISCALRISCAICRIYSRITLLLESEISKRNYLLWPYSPVCVRPG